MSRMYRYARSMLVPLAMCMLVPHLVRSQTDVTKTAATIAAWAPERFPSDFFNVASSFQGRTDVFQLGLGTDGEQLNRPPAFASSFYNFQGDSININQRPGSLPSFTEAGYSLWIPTDQQTNATQNVNEMFCENLRPAAADDGSTMSPCIAFTNKFGTGMFQYLTGAGVPVTLSLAGVNYGAWNDVLLVQNGNQESAYVNGVFQISEVLDPSYTFLSSISLKAENIPQQSVVLLAAPGPGKGKLALTSDAPSTITSVSSWSLIPTLEQPPVISTPEPASWALMTTGLVGLGGFIRRRNRKVA